MDGIYEILTTQMSHTDLRITADPENANLGLDIIENWGKRKRTIHYSELNREQATQVRDLLNQFLGE